MKKKVNVFGKKLPVFMIALFAIGLASAALLSYYGVITGTFVAAQSVLVDGNNWNVGVTDEISESAPGGEEFCFKHFLKNDASVSTNVTFEDDCNAVAKEGGWMNCDGTTKTHYVMPEEITLEFCKKQMNF